MNLEPLSTNAFVLALSKLTISEKCRDLSKLIDESSTKLLHHNFALIVQNIFGYNAPGWGIQNINPRQRSLECFILKEFLGCNGPMFRLVHKLQAESMLFRYEFPCNLLPSNFIQTPAEQAHSQQRVLRQTQNLSFNSSQFSTATANSLKGQTCVRVSAFEFYFYHFAYCIVTSTSPTLPPINYYGYQQVPISPDENLYFLLVDEYLLYFLPTDGSCPPTLQTPSSNTQSGVRSTPWMSHVSSMLRKTPATQTTSLGITQNDIWRSDLLVHVFVEFWLGKPTSQHGNEQSLLPPSEDLMRAVRRLVKHMHYFNNVNKSSMFLSQASDSFLDQFKQNVMCSCLQPRLYEFLSHCFKVWPLNSTFRIVLETWLSYIQPWRYMEITESMSTEMRLSTDREIANMWYHFITNNLQFYNKLFCSAITRFLRMDISKQANSLLLYRVTKIFSQPNLLEMVLEAEAGIYGERSALYSSPAPGSYIAPARSSEVSIYSPGYLLGSEEVRRMVSQMLVVCQQSLGTVMKYSQSSKTDFSSRLLNAIGLGSLALMGSDSNIDMSWKKSEQQIQDSIQALSEMFDLSVPELDYSFHSQSQLENPLGPDAPDCSINENGKVELSDLGRHEMINNIKKLPVVANTDPELQPITSFENAFLVRLFYRVASALNAKYSDHFQHLCSRTDFLGKLSKHLLLSSDETSQQVRRQNLNANARISLRYFAHYRTIFYFTLYFVLCTASGVGLIFGLFYLLLFMFAYFVLKVLVKEYLRH